MEKISGDIIQGYWYNPREDKSISVESFKNTKKIKAFVPPSSGVRTDWVLVLDDKEKNYPNPTKTILK